MPVTASPIHATQLPVRNGTGTFARWSKPMLTQLPLLLLLLLLLLHMSCFCRQICFDMPQKSCRLRWYNQLCPGVKRTPFSEWEQAVIIKVGSVLAWAWGCPARQGRAWGCPAGQFAWSVLAWQHRAVWQQGVCWCCHGLACRTICMRCAGMSLGLSCRTVCIGCAGSMGCAGLVMGLSRTICMGCAGMAWSWPAGQVVWGALAWA